MFLYFVFAFAALTSLASAGFGVSTSAFTSNGGFQAAQISQPLFYFASGSCYPQDGEVNGQQTNGNAQDNCLINNLSSGCQYQIPWIVPNAKAAQIATYYSVTHCGGDNSYRILYDLYFRHDSAHGSDWEWAAVVWKQNADGWYTERVILEQHGKTPSVSWRDLETFDNNADMFNGGRGQNKNHPRIYVDKYYHSMWPTPNNANKNNCAVIPAQSFRANDWYLFDLQNPNLAPISRINPNWGYGKATNPHATTRAICGY